MTEPRRQSLTLVPDNARPSPVPESSRPRATPQRRRSTPRPLDEIDHAILNLLQADSNRSDAEVARRVGLSASGLKKRLKRLSQHGVLQSRVALVDRHAVGLRLLCFVQVALTHPDLGTAQPFRKAVKNIPEVMECHSLTGEYDYLLKIVARDHADLERILAKHLTSAPGVDRLLTSMVLNEVKHTTALPLKAPPRDAAQAS